MHRSLLLILTLAALTTGCGDWTFGRTLEGVVVDSGSRLKATESGAQQKISILIKADNPNAKIKEVACGPSGCAIECLSTRCASIAVGTCHRFACKYDYRFNEPDVIACKHEKEIECPKGNGG